MSIVRVITSIVLSRGPQNEQTIESTKVFLTENRPLVVSMFKRQARIGGVSFDDAGVDIEELVELFMLLIEMTGFLDVGYADEYLITRAEADIAFSLKSNEIPQSRGGQPSLNVDLKCDGGKVAAVDGSADGSFGRGLSSNIQSFDGHGNYCLRLLKINLKNGSIASNTFQSIESRGDS